MNLELLQEVLEEMGSSLAEMEARNGALLQLLKNKGMVTDEELEPLVAEAGKAANVRWRAARIRLESQIAAEKDKEEREREKAREEKEAADKNARKPTTGAVPTAAGAGAAVGAAAVEKPAKAPDGTKAKPEEAEAKPAKTETKKNEPEKQNGGAAGNATPPKDGQPTGPEPSVVNKAVKPS